jgi:antitoxin PrlF
VDSKITAKGQMTLPKEIREHLKVKPGDRVKIFIQPDGHVVLLPMIPVTALKGIAKSRLSRPVTLEEMHEAIAAGAIAGAGLSRRGHKK